MTWDVILLFLWVELINNYEISQRKTLKIPKIFAISNFVSIKNMDINFMLQCQFSFKFWHGILIKAMVALTLGSI